MKKSKYWFKRKEYGYGWTPSTWQGWTVTSVYIVMMINAFVTIDAQHHSINDTLINFVPTVLLYTGLFLLITHLTGETPRWQWGTQKSKKKRSK